MRRAVASALAFILLGMVTALSAPPTADAQDAERQYVIGVSGMT